jgi:hypothetical protein
MNKQEVLKLMITSINEDNREMAERSNMDKDLYEKMFDESQPSLQFIVTNLYDKMEAAGVLKS